MAKNNIDDYIKDLSPELQEKARACKSREEIMALAAEEDFELTQDILENVSGGCSTKKTAYCRIHNIECQPKYNNSSPAMGSVMYYCNLCDKYYPQEDVDLK